MLLNELDQKILKILLEEEKPVSGKMLALLCDVSINTIRKEVGMINEEVKGAGFCIESKTSLGYYPKITDEKLAEPYMEQFRYLYKRNQRMQNKLSERVQHLIRVCLCSGGHLTVESLCDELYCSKSTILRDLEQVKRYLDDFGLRLVNWRGGAYSLYVEGNEWDIRQCLIRQKKIYNLTLKKDNYKEYAFKTLFFMLDGIDYYGQIREVLIRCLEEEKRFSLPAIHLPTIAHYIQLIVSREKQAVNCWFSEEQLSRARRAAEYSFVKKIHARLPGRFREAFKEMDFLALTMLVMSYETQNVFLREGEEYQGYYEEVQELIDGIERQWGTPKELFDECFVQDFICFLYTLHNRRVFGCYSDAEQQGYIWRQGIGTVVFCLYFARFYENKHGIHLTEEDTIGTYYLFYRVLREYSTCYYAKKILVISRYGLPYTRALAANIRRNYREEITEISVFESDQAYKDNPQKYDLLITDMRREHLPAALSHMETLSVDFFLGRRQYTEMDDYLACARQAAERGLLTADSFIYTDLKNREAVIRYAARLYEGEGWEQEDIIRHLEENEAFICQERDCGVVFLPILLESRERPRITVLVNRTAFLWKEIDIEVFICYTRGKQDQENIILNSVLRRFLHISVEKMKMLHDETEDPVRILYQEM